MTAHGKSTALREWVESKRASAMPPPNTELDPAADPALQGIPRVGEEILGGKYVVERVLGIGGMGVVCAAFHKTLKQRVAVKFLSAPMRSVELVDRFIREGQAAVRIKSEHIATVLDVGVLDDGTPYLMMEHLEGADLSDYLLERKLLPIEEAVDFVLQALDALAVAHSSGVVHRDLKPSNLFVTQRSDGSPLVKVLDFGISKMTESGPSPTATLTQPGMMLGSPRYMSPEQLRNASGVDLRADIWAMGIVLQELLSGRPPYDADTFTALCTMIACESPTRLREVVPDAPEELEQVILKCLERKADDRYQNVGELALALLPFAPAESRPIATRIQKILGQIPSKSPPGAASAKGSSGGTPKPARAPSDATPSDRTLPLPDAGRPSGVPSSTPAPHAVPSSGRGAMATTGDAPAIGGRGPLTDPNASALAISTAKAGPASSKKPLAIAAGLVLGLAALAFFATRKNEASATPATPPPPTAMTAAPTAEPAAMPAATATTTTPSASVAEPASSVVPTPSSLPGAAPLVTPNVPVGVGAPRSRPVAAPKPSAAPAASPAAAQPTDEELLNRRH